MAIKRILISQPKPSSEHKSPFAPLKDKFNLGIDFFPLIKVEGVELQEFISQRIKILDHTVVIFTSRTLIDNFFRLVSESRITIPDSMKYYCISEAVALYLQKYIVYRKRKISFASGSVTSLMELILKHNSEKYFLPLSEPYKPELPMAMERAALNFSKAVLSHTVCSDLGDMDASQYDIIAMYSPLEVHNYPALVERGFKGSVAVFGEATAKIALASGIVVSIMAPSKKYPSMTGAIDAYCTAASNGEDLSSFTVKSLENTSQSELLKMAEKRRVRCRKTAVSASSSAASKNIKVKSTTTRSATPRSVSVAASKTLVKKP
ncbi:MAG: uroporphyrinogen-III synthase [Rikenellaceae bacterium]